MFERDRRRRVAGNDGQAWAISLDEATEQGGHSAGDFGFAALAIGIAGTVGRIDDRRVR